MTILLLGGSPAAPSSTGRLLDHVGDKLAALGHRHSKLNVRDLPAKALLHADFADLRSSARGRRGRSGRHRDRHACYKASYTGILKAFLDLLPQDGLKDKLVLPLATGGSQSHLLALDYALRPVLQALDARQVFTSIYATSQQLTWSDVSGLTLDQAIAWRVQAGVDALSAALHALRREPEQVFVANQPVRLAR
jgi:FMN reductase